MLKIEMILKKIFGPNLQLHPSPHKRKYRKKATQKTMKTWIKLMDGIESPESAINFFFRTFASSTILSFRYNTIG